jgi:Domain of unknown function (DUF4432)
MASLYRESLSRREIAQRSGMLSQFAGVRLMTLGDGVERGIRMVEFRTGSGLRFTVLIDRAFDIADCDYCGAAIGWHSPAGFRHPGLHEYEGEGGLAWLRSFSGLLVTCGLDHILFMDSDSAEHYHYQHRKSVDSSIHGRVSTIPGRLLGYGEHWEGDECTLYCEGIVQQSTVFGEDLHLRRRIEARVGSSQFTIHDQVINHGFYRTPHMFCYHINVGYPVLDEESRYIAPIKEVTWAAHAETYRKQNVGYRRAAGPRQSFHEQVWEHWLAADSGRKVPVAIVNERFNAGQGIGILVEVSKDEFPCHFQWQNFQEGQYVIGLEPSTNHVLGKPFARKRGELIWLEHAEERNYTTRFEVLGNRNAIERVENWIRAVAKPPDEDYPVPTDNWEPLR